MIDRNTVIAALQKCGAYAADKTPSPSELTIQAWQEHFALYPAISSQDLLDAVTKLFSGPLPDRLVQPSDVSRIARDSRQDRAMRAPNRAIDGGAPSTPEHRRKCIESVRAHLAGGKFGSMPI